ncbi:MAG TPA: sigma-70 family RNA polymerase sigma factor [Thermoanaerobaculia bacterium]|nr:sigma-70 family RNA polymerase sigma factor [Thermoanaerobaculia bacterium]
MATAVIPLEPASQAQRERDLVDRHRRGEREAFEEYYAAHAGLIYNLTLRQCGDPELARDLSQEILFKVFRGLGRFRGVSSLKTWTYRICINHCRSRLGRRRLPTQSLQTADGREHEVADPGRGPEESLIADEEGRRLAAALPEIDRVFREAIVLRDLEGLSYQEIADVLDVPIGTVRSRIARGREQLRKSLLPDSGPARLPDPGLAARDR